MQLFADMLQEIASDLRARGRRMFGRRLDEAELNLDHVERSGLKGAFDERVVKVNHADLARIEPLQSPAVHLLQGIEIGLETDEIGARPLVAAALFQLGDLRLDAGFFARVLFERLAVTEEVLLGAVQLGASSGDALLGVTDQLLSACEFGSCQRQSGRPNEAGTYSCSSASASMFCRISMSSADIADNSRSSARSATRSDCKAA